MSRRNSSPMTERQSGPSTPADMNSRLRIILAGTATSPARTTPARSRGKLIRAIGGLLGALLLPTGASAANLALTTAEATHAVLSQNSSVQNPVSFTGNIGVFAGGSFTLNGDTVAGRVDYAGAINHQLTGAWTITGGESANVALVGTAQTDAACLAAAIVGLSGTSIADISASKTLNPGVYDVSKVSLGSHDTLTLSGGASDQFVLRINDTFGLPGGQIALTGGATPDHVFFYYTGASDVNLRNGSQFAGITITNGQVSSIKLPYALIGTTASHTVIWAAVTLTHSAGVGSGPYPPPSTPPVCTLASSIETYDSITGITHAFAFVSPAQTSGNTAASRPCRTNALK